MRIRRRDCSGVSDALATANANVTVNFHLRRVVIDVVNVGTRRCDRPTVTTTASLKGGGGGGRYHRGLRVVDACTILQ